MDSGILDVKLIPTWDSPGILKLLRHSLSEAKLLQAAIAYWTVNDKMFGGRLANALAHRDGFLCVDLHQPTDVDSLASLATKKSHIYLYCEDITTYSEWGQKEPASLIHSKMLLFWYADGTAELWVGSHNWTNRAILGLNVESSVILKLRHSAPIFVEAIEYLAKIKAVSERFDLDSVAFYKHLQGKMSKQDISSVIELEGHNAGNLDDLTITFFGTDADDVKEIRTLGSEVYVSVCDPDSNREHFYPASILHLGFLSAADPAAAGISFEPRPYAFRMGRRLPYLRPKEIVDQNILNTAQYFVTLRLGQIDSNLVAEPVPIRTAAWERVNDQSSPLVRRLDASTLGTLFRGRNSRVRRPVRLAGDDTTEALQSRALTLLERRSLPDRKVVTKRILRRRG